MDSSRVADDPPGPMARQRMMQTPTTTLSPTRDPVPHYVLGVDPKAAAALLDALHREQGRFYAGDADADAALRRLLTDDIAWHVPGRNPIAGDYHGIDEVFAYYTRRRALAAGTMRMHRRELLIGEAGHVASLTDGTATIGGIEHRWSTMGLYRVVNHRIAECWLLPLDPAQFDRVWTAADPPDAAG